VNKLKFLGIFIALQASFLAILVPLSLSLSKDLINEMRLFKEYEIDKEKKKIISFWYYSDFLMSATAFFGGYSLIIAFLVLFKVEAEEIKTIFRALSFFYWLWIFYSLWKVLESRVFILDKKEKWLYGAETTVIYVLIWSIFFAIIHNCIMKDDYNNTFFWLSLKSVLLFMFWYAGGIIYLPLTNLFRTAPPPKK